MMHDGESRILSVVIPAHAEAAGIVHATNVIAQVLASCGMQWEIIVVDDGSPDGTFDRVRELFQRDARIKGLRFSRNFGKEAAILAGLRAARGDIVVTIDADLQHPPDLIVQMLEEWRKGAVVVDGVKRKREIDSVQARWRARLFNSVLTRLGGINLENSSDFKLLDRTVVDAITRMLPERERFYRGLSDWVGYRHVRVPFDVAPRLGGQGKWSLWKLAELATTATVSFTSAPLRIVTILGLVTLVFGFIIGSEVLIGWAVGYTVSGFATIVSTMLILGSFIMISLGIIGEYIAKIYDEIKARPSYLVESSVGLDALDSSQQATPSNVHRVNASLSR
jgi:glycosyltransferase involved in cell wall biosynthesis